MINICITTYTYVILEFTTLQGSFLYKSVARGIQQQTLYEMLSVTLLNSILICVFFSFDCKAITKAELQTEQP